METVEAGPAPFPAGLRMLYGGALALSSPIVYANFVATLDGVVAIPGAPHSSSVISGSHPADRFVMGMLRALADAVLVGAGTVRAEPRHRWLPSVAYPPAADQFARLRSQLGKPDAPRLVVVTATGNIDPLQPGIAERALVATTPLGASRLHGRLPDSNLLVGQGDSVNLAELVERLHRAGFADILTEGGPTLFGSLVDQGLVDELFLTLAPQLAGRRKDEASLNLVHGVRWLPGESRPAELLSLRRHGSFLFARYALSAAARVTATPTRSGS